MKTGALAAASLLAAVCCPAAAAELSAGNTSRYLGDGRWEWTVFLRGPAELLADVRCVVYTLHPSERNPVRRVCTPGSDRSFPLSGTSWGSFEVGIEVELRDGRPQRLKHGLALSRAPQSTPLPALRTGNLARNLGPSWWEWTAFVHGDEAALAAVESVEYTLHPTFTRSVQVVRERGRHCSRAFPLSTSGWGTFTLGIRVRYRDGREQALKHDLSFADARGCSRVESLRLNAGRVHTLVSPCFDGGLHLTVDGIDSAWRKAPFDVELFAAAAPVRDRKEWARLREAGRARPLANLTVGQDGASVAFRHAGREFLLTASRVQPGAGGGGSVGLEVCEK